MYIDDLGVITSPPAHIAWLAADIAPRYVAAFSDCLAEGWVLVLAAAGRTAEKAKELYGKPDGHQAGRAIDVSFNTMRRWYPSFSVAKIDGILGSHGFHPLGASRPKDGNHYQTDDYGGVRKIGPQRFKNLDEACLWVGNGLTDAGRARA